MRDTIIEESRLEQNFLDCEKKLTETPTDKLSEWRRAKGFRAVLWSMGVRSNVELRRLELSDFGLNWGLRFMLAKSPIILTSESLNFIVLYRQPIQH